jgi:DNA recombination-dependent growth factor C
MQLLKHFKKKLIYLTLSEHKILPFSVVLDVEEEGLKKIIKNTLYIL